MNFWCSAKVQFVKPVGLGGSPGRCLRLEAMQGTERMRKLVRRWTDLKGAETGKGNGWGWWGRWNGWKEGPSSVDGESSLAFKILQWNVLADGLAQNGNFVKVPNDALEWENRWPLILNEIEDSDADIICLQEVNTYEKYLKPALESKGYKSFFIPKTHSPAESYNKLPDGCAVFFKSVRFSPVGETVAYPYLEQKKPMNQVCTALCLHDNLSRRRFLLATTHLKAKNGSKNSTARVTQVNQLIKLMEEMSKTQLKQSSLDTSSSVIPMLICGDFNDTPNSLPCTELSGSSLGLKSLWDVPVYGEEESELITTFKHRPGGEARRVIDYIWFTNDSRWKPTKRWIMPSIDEIGPNGLPGYHYPSDHLAVCAQFEWI